MEAGTDLSLFGEGLDSTVSGRVTDTFSPKHGKVSPLAPIPSRPYYKYFGKFRPHSNLAKARIYG